MIVHVTYKGIELRCVGEKYDEIRESEYEPGQREFFEFDSIHSMSGENVLDVFTDEANNEIEQLVLDSM